MRLNLSSLVVDLPEDILKAKWAGDFEAEKALIDARLQKNNLLSLLRDRLLVERALIDRLPGRFPYTRDEAIAIMQARFRNFTEAEFDELEKDGCMDYLYIMGQKRYLRSFAGTLLRMRASLAAREINPEAGGANKLDAFIAEVRQRGEAGRFFRLRGEMRLSDDAFIPGETYRAHLPVPAPAAQQPLQDIDIDCDPDGFIASPDSHQRTVFYERPLGKNLPFRVSFSYSSRIRYVDPLAGDAPASEVYPDALPVCADDLSELYPHIRFTPYLRALCDTLIEGVNDPMARARRIYDYITQNVRYSFMRSYILIDMHAEYAALNLKGDCGIQAILFITLCRMAGIPARWQSGLTVDAEGTGQHDWAQFYVAPWGWLFADPSFGGSAWRKGAKERWNFYFGNLDPFRMVANRRYQTDFTPDKRHERFDPYDNQEGEIECGAKGFDVRDFDTEFTTEMIATR